MIGTVTDGRLDDAHDAIEREPAGDAPGDRLDVVRHGTNAVGDEPARDDPGAEEPKREHGDAGEPDGKHGETCRHDEGGGRR